MFRSIVVLSLLISSSLSFAQRGPGSTSRGSGIEVYVRVMFENSHPAGELVHVQLQTTSNMLVSESFTDSRGEVRFSGVRPGAYHVKVKGTGIEETIGDNFEITPRDMSSFQMVTARRTEDAIANERAAAGQVSAAELNIPDKARKEFDKGTDLLQKGKSDEGIKHLSRATEIYPQYAGAFDAIGLALMATSPAEGKQYFEKALAADKQYQPSYAHLAKANMAENNFAEAERLMLQAVPANPRSAENLFLLAYAESKLGKYEAALDAVRRTHQLEHSKYALVHFISAEAFTKTGRPVEAVEEYQVYLKEAPLGPSVDIAKKNISVLQARLVAK